MSRLIIKSVNLFSKTVAQSWDYKANCAYCHIEPYGFIGRQRWGFNTKEPAYYAKNETNNKKHSVQK